MTTKIAANQLTALEREQIDRDIDEDLVDHLYKGVPSGLAGGIVGSVNVFVFFYYQVNHSFLFVWFGTYILTLIMTATLFFLYRSNKDALKISHWGFLLKFLIAVFSLLWGICIFFNPVDTLHELIILAIIFMAAASMSMGGVGFFEWSTVYVFLVLTPVGTKWLFLSEGLTYKIASVFVMIYIVFLIGLNYRSAKWLKTSLRLKLENSYFTHQANHDLLTGLPNQRALMQYLEENIKLNVNFVIMCFSVNRAEMFNISLGYQASDLIIQTVANRLNSMARHIMRSQAEECFVTHPRTDSFVVVINHMREEKLDGITKEFFEALNIPFRIENREARLTGSIGLCVYPNDGEDGRTLLSNAYAAMFQAKQRGGNQVQHYHREINEKTPYLLDLENDLFYALERREFRVYYQPIIDLRSGKISGMEALLRWKHPKRGMVLPMDFIPLAEENGLIIPIGQWVLTQAAYQTMQWQKQGFDALNFRLAVNLSPRQLRQGDLLETIKDVLKKTGLNANSLDLELTESAILDEAIAPLIKEITQLGITLSIDDFGTGYSGLSYLKFFRIDRIKIDKSFIADVNTNIESATIVSAMLAMGKELGIKTLAEGVETEDQLKFLLEKGCQYAQGYYFSRPISVMEFTDLIKNNMKFDLVNFKTKSLQHKLSDH